MLRITKLKIPNYLVLVFLLNGLTLFGQENNKNSKTIKLYTNFSWSNTDMSLSYDTVNKTSTIENSKETQIGYFTPSFSFSSLNGNFQEFELSRLLINKTQNQTIETVDSTGQTINTLAGEKSTNIFIAFRYEYDIMLFKKKEGTKFQSFIGFSANPFYSNSSFTPIVSTLYPSTQNNFGVLLSVIPRLNYNLNEKWFIDLNIPINLVDANWMFRSEEDPTLTEEQRITTTVNFSTFPKKFLIRLGVGLRI